MEFLMQRSSEELQLPALLVVTWRIVSAAVDNGVDKLTHTLGNGAPRAKWGDVARKGGQ